MTQSPIDITHSLSLVADDMRRVNDCIHTNLNSGIELINQISNYIIIAGGKRLRPVILLLIARAIKPELNQCEQSHILLASIIEYIHTATLLHDDVVDESELRRGRETANEVFGNAASVLVGDFLYSRSFQMMVELKDMTVMDILSRTTNQIAEGEVLQLMNCGCADTTESQYMDTIQSKTAILFEAAAQLGAVKTNNREMKYHMATFGRHLGTAFQLMDDILDYSADSSTLGKNVGDDLAEGKPTLPLIRAIKVSNTQQKEVLINAITHSSIENLDQVLAIIADTKALKYTKKKAQQEITLAKQALSILPESDYKTALFNIADFAIERDI